MLSSSESGVTPWQLGPTRMSDLRACFCMNALLFPERVSIIYRVTVGQGIAMSYGGYSSLTRAGKMNLWKKTDGNNSRRLPTVRRFSCDKSIKQNFDHSGWHPSTCMVMKYQGITHRPLHWIPGTATRNEHQSRDGAISKRHWEDDRNYERLFGTRPSRKFQSPLERVTLRWTHRTYLMMSLIGAMQWAVSLTRMDSATALSGFRIAPRVGHLERFKRVYGYIAKFKAASIRVRTNQPDCSILQ